MRGAKYIQKVFALALCLLNVSCAGEKEPYLYDRPGFDEGSRPVDNTNSNPQATPYPYSDQQYYNSGRGSPSQDSYQNRQAIPRTHPYYPSQNYFYQGEPYYQQPYPAEPGSRFFSNPYAIPPSGSYLPYPYPYYDTDQYYVPPSYYNNVEPEQRR